MCGLTIGVDASRTLPAYRTGTEQYSVALLQALMRLPNPHHWRLYAPGPPPDDLLPLPMGWEWRAMPFPRLWTHLRLSAEMLRAAPDVLFVPAHVVPFVHPRRTVVTIHDLGYLHFSEAHPARDRRYLDRATRWSAHTACRVIAISHATCDDLVHFLHIPQAKIAVVPHGVNGVDGADGANAAMIGASEDSIAEVLARHGIMAPYVLALGTVQPRKNLVRLVAAFGAMRAAGLPHTLVIVGRSGWLADPIYEAVTTHGLTEHVRFTGYVPDADLPALYAGADVLAFVSLYEGFGMPALEAMAYSTPVVVANTSSLPEVVGDAGLLVDPTNVAAIAAALTRVVSDRTLRARLVAAGRARVAEYTWERCARETLAVLESTARDG